MGWLSSLFNFDTARRVGKNQVFSSTNDAFSLPTSSPVFLPPHPDVFNPETLSTPELTTPTTFTYPPQVQAFAYSPSSGRAAFTSLLPTHMDAVHTAAQARTPYPPLSKTWARIHNWLSKEYPELGDTLNYGIPPQDLSQIEMQFGFALPAVVRESYLCVDGQEAESAAGCSEGLFFGLKLLPLESVLEEWRFWREVDHDPMTGANLSLLESMHSIPPNWVRKLYSQRGWIPLIADKAGNYIGVDLNPAEGGQVGQVIVFGRDFDTKVVLWKGDGMTGWAKWLSNFAEELENGECFEIGNNEGSEGSEDELGYEGYFYDGKGRGQGDGGGDSGSGGGLRLTGEYNGWNVLEAWADRSLRKWHEAGVITDSDLVPMEGTPIKQLPVDLDVVDSQQGSGTEIHIPVLNYPHERIPSPPNGVRVHRSQQSQATITPTKLPKKREVPHTISITKPPAPLPVGLPTPQDIAPLPSPPDSFHSDDDLEAGRGHGVELSMSTLSRDEDLGLVTATRRTGKSKSPIQRESSDATASSLPLPPTPPSGDLVTPKTNSLYSNSNMNILPIVAPVPVQAALTAKDVPDLLTDPIPGALEIDSAPTLKPSPSSSSFSTGSRTPQKEKETNMNFPTGSSNKGTEEETLAVVEPVSTIRLIGGGGQSGVSQSPVKVTAEEITLDHRPDSSSPHSTHFSLKDLSDITPVAAPMSTPPATESAASGPETSDAAPVVAGKKGHKKSKGSLASLKRFSVGALGKKKDSSVKDVLSPSR